VSATLAAPPVPGAAEATSGRPARELLADGSPALLRRLGPEDGPEVLDLHARLRERDRYLRFATLHPSDLEDYLARTLTGAGGAVAIGARVRGRLVGMVDLHLVGGDAAEVAAVVDADWHGHGVATALLEELAAAAQRLGVRRLLAEVLAENGRMLRVLTDLGLPIGVTREDCALRIEVALHADERYAAAAEDRHRRAAAAGLRAVMTPRSVAVVGAGRATDSLGRAVLRSLHRAGFAGTVVAVNPHADRIEGVPCLPRVGDLPEGVDLAVVTVPADALAAAVEECGERGVRAVLVITSGVAEVPGLAARLRELADRYALRLVGPNTVGVIGPGAVTRLDTTFTPVSPPPGDLGLVTQSGGVAIAVGSAWLRLGLGLSAMAAIGDALDVGARDLLAWFDEDPGTQLVVLYA
jgi:predicted CoA-binding protein/RimJ/RimL family protein N-acetyltransferase